MGPIEPTIYVSSDVKDTDITVKLIDVYPDEVAGQPAMGGYQLMISADIFRGRYRESFETPKASRFPRASRPSSIACGRSRRSGGSRWSC